MTTEEFDHILDARIESMKRVLSSKASEYARGDRLSNFKQGAIPLKVTPEKYLVALWMKHVISICDFVNDLEAGKMAPSSLWDEKIGDATNYLVLLDALINERIIPSIEMKEV